MVFTLRKVNTQVFTQKKQKPNIYLKESIYPVFSTRVYQVLIRISGEKVKKVNTTVKPERYLRGCFYGKPTTYSCGSYHYCIWITSQRARRDSRSLLPHCFLIVLRLRSLQISRRGINLICAIFFVAHGAGGTRYGHSSPRTFPSPNISSIF